MSRARSIRFKLICLYVGLLTAIFICFSGYIYVGFRQFLLRSLDQTLERRARQISSTILEELPTRGETWVGMEIQARYAPELNERVIRITDEKGRVIYASKNAAELNRLPLLGGHEEFPANQTLRVDTARHFFSNGALCIVEVGAPETEITNELRSLLIMLGISIPVLIGLAVLGGHFLLGRALRPVDQIVSAAEQITFKNLRQRLPVPATGDEFERMSQALNRMIQRLEESFRIAHRFSADASHELRTPLTIIRGEIEEIGQQPGLSAEMAERVGEILEEVDRLARIIEGLLLVSRLEAGESRLAREKLDLGQLAASIADQMELLIEEKNIALTREISFGVQVEGDRVRLQQMAVNLLDNAVKYTPSQGTIHLSVRTKDREALLEVLDTGMGIHPAALPHLFERFFRSEEVKADRIQGTGLGLSIVQSIVEAHGGTIVASNNSPKGAIFQVRLPLAS